MLGERLHLGHFVSLGIGGADRTAFQLALGLRDLGIRQTVFFGENSIPKKATITADQDPQAPVHSIEPFYASADLPLVRVQSADEILKFGVNVLQTHRSGEDSWLLPGIDEAQKGLTVVETNFHGILMSHADFRVFPSRALMKHKSIPESSHNVVIPNPVMSPMTNDNFKRFLGLNDRVVLGRVGRSDRSIYSPKLLVAFLLFQRHVPNSTLIWIGASSQAKRDAVFLGIQDIIWVEALADQEDLSKWLNTMDIFCHVNKLGETFGNAVAEAMSHGLPVVSLRGSRSYPQAQEEVIGSSDAVTNSIRAFVAALVTMAENEEQRSREGIRNANRAQATFSTLVVATQYANLYRTALTD